MNWLETLFGKVRESIAQRQQRVEIERLTAQLKFAQSELEKERERFDEELRQRDEKVARLESDVRLRDSEIQQLADIAERDRARIKAETAFYTRTELESTQGESRVCPTCHRMV